MGLTGRGGSMSEGVLAGRTAIVTGASRGIGAFIAERFAAEGAAVAVTARTVDPSSSRFDGTIHETVYRINEAGGRAIAIAADLSQMEDRERLVGEAEGAFGRIDILVNNAAVTFTAPLVEFPPRRRQIMFEVQVFAPMDLVRLVLPGMVANGAGWILNVSSGASRHPVVPPTGPQGFPGSAVYGMCKAALERYTTGLAAELYDSNVAVNSMSPSRVVPTPGTVYHHLVRPDDPTQEVEPPELFAAAALALCSVDPKSRTGLVTYSQDLLKQLGSDAPTYEVAR
jgi:NAD(P)-dependent dehydrogenase (short-subunit alcohol dehydrogenase family)